MPNTRIVVFSLVILLAGGAAYAQSNKGGISGTVFDETGAVVAAASVSLRNLGTGESLRLTTSTAGTFSAPLLDPVEYEIAVNAKGFKTAVVSRVKVDTGSTATVKVTLQLGDLATEVSVSADPPLLSRASGTPGQTITERQIAEMPLNNRSVLDLALPGRCCGPTFSTCRCPKAFTR